MKKRLTTLLLALNAAVCTLQAQNTDTLPPLGGLVLDDSVYATAGAPRAVNRDIRPGAQKSLLAQSGISPFNQRCEPACGSCAVTAAIMIRLKFYCDGQCKCSSKVLTFSWSYLHNQLVRLYGTQNIHLKDVLDLLKSQGTLSADDFPNTPCSHDHLPNAAQRRKADDYRFWTYEPVFTARKNFSEPAAIADSLFRAQLAPSTIAWIDQGIPVVIGLVVTENFRDLNSGDCLWHPVDPNKKRTGHALVVTGYDNNRKQFELLNSYGKNWGCDGVSYISYNDYSWVVKEGYVLKFDFKSGKKIQCPTDGSKK